MTHLRAIVLTLFLVSCGVSDGAPPIGNFDCTEHAAGTGDVAADVVGRWFWIQNASPQYFTFEAGGSAVRTWTSDESDDVRHSRHQYFVEGDMVRIEDYGDFRFVFADGAWTVDDPAAITDWIRCREV